ncbi:MAG: 50S ribosomal protein L5 [Verrucomicrobiae bacterium]|nr:50S ribosomal protein L5 [Verrucomicrobiae bacterium]
MPSRLQDHYKQKVIPALVTARGYKNPFEVPKLEKIVITMGVPTAVSKNDKTAVDEAMKELAAISGQKPVLCVSRKNISNFNLRKGQVIGCRVTLRGQRMYEFFDRLVSAALPRIRDFRGLPLRSFDGRGNYSLGLSEQTIFPEIDMDKVKRQQGMHVTIVTSARTDEEAKLLLQEMGLPFARPQARPAVEAKGQPKVEAAVEARKE